MYREESDGEPWKGNSGNVCDTPRDITTKAKRAKPVPGKAKRKSRSAHEREETAPSK
jgi:hypothetical protein